MALAALDSLILEGLSNIIDGNSTKKHPSQQQDCAQAFLDGLQRREQMESPGKQSPVRTQGEDTQGQCRSSAPVWRQLEQTQGSDPAQL